MLQLKSRRTPCNPSHGAITSKEQGIDHRRLRLFTVGCDALLGLAFRVLEDNQGKFNAEPKDCSFGRGASTPIHGCFGCHLVLSPCLCTSDSFLASYMYHAAICAITGGPS